MSQEPAKLLREHGIQVTAQRVAVLKAVSAHPHSTADVVSVAVKADIGTISKQAVYDALGMLSEKGLIRRIPTKIALVITTIMRSAELAAKRSTSTVLPEQPPVLPR